MFCVRGLPTILFAFLSLPFHLHLCVVGDVLDIKNFNLRPNALGTALRDRADKLGEVLGAKASVTKIMGNLNRPEGAGNVSNGQPCNPRAVAVRVDIEKSICFDSGDTNTDQWYPQGVTTVADMQADQSWGDGLRPILVSWYHNDTDGEGVDKGVRISFVDSVGGKYRHVLLVYPQMLDSGDPTYNSIRVSQNPRAKGYKTSLHAGGIIWYGNHLYVADTARGFRMFDMRRIYDLGESPRGRTSSPELIGLYIGAYYGHGYRYIMPQVGSWTRTADPGKTCSDSNDLAPNFSYVSLDRSGTDALVVGEYCNGSIKGWPAGEKKSKGRVVVWEIGESLGRDGELITESNYRWSAVNAYKLPVSNVQGATRFKGKWYLSQSNGTNNAGKLHITEYTTTTTTDLKVASSQPLGFGPEDLSHWPKGTGTDQALGVLWTVGEHVGKRMLYSVVPVVPAN